MSFLPDLLTRFPRTPMRNWGDVHPMFGGILFDLDGADILRGRPFGRPGRRLPAVLDNHQVVTGDLIPSTSWGANLANLLTKKSWDQLRQPLIESHHHVCELCGGQFESLDVHEVWRYDFPPKEELGAAQKGDIVFGVQHLAGLMAICHDCHECFHLGRAAFRGRLDIVLQRLAALNGWPNSVADDYYEYVMQRHEFASRIYWLLDFSWVKHPEGGLTLKGSWRTHPQDMRFITSSNATTGGENLTALLNVPWRFVREDVWKEAMSLATLEATPASSNEKT